MHKHTSIPFAHDQLVGFLNQLQYYISWEGKFSGLPGDEAYQCTLGLGIPTDVLIVDTTTTKQHIQQFCFVDKRPVIGYLSYEYGSVVKDLDNIQNQNLPLGVFKKYSSYCIYKQGILTLYTCDLDIQFPWISILYSKYQDLIVCPELNLKSFKPSLNEAQFLHRLHKAQEYIKNGYTFQLTVSICFELNVEIKCIQSLFLYSMQTYPAAHYAYLNVGAFSIISASPEQFLNVKNGFIQAEPIKGTYKLHEASSLEEGIAWLTNSAKESQELSMVVDLARNDISLNSEIGSVRVAQHKSIFQVDNLLQMYSVINSVLKSNADVIDLLIDAFPACSVTGFPKLKTMQIISELEPHAREIYCGSIFIIEGPQDMDASVAIRTGFYDGEHQLFKFYAGSGITAHSNGPDEYLEVLAKASKFLNIFSIQAI